MKRQRFRLGNVLKHYELQKQRAEFDLQQANQVLRETDREIATLNDEVAGIAAVLNGPHAAALSAAAWMACHRNAEYLATRIVAAQARRVGEAKLAAECAERRKRWAIAEETLRSLRASVDKANRAEEAKAEQLQLDESVLRRWVVPDEDI